MSKFFVDGHLRYQAGAWRDDNGDAVDIQPVRHGRWVHAKTYYDLDECNCSLCGQLMTTEIGKRMNYCPNCGAKMRGGNDE